MSEGTGAEVMQRIAAPMIGGMVTAPLLSMLVIPAAYYLMRSRRISASGRMEPDAQMIPAAPSDRV
jgi:Cu(I)/Ag(I) efflux system membrane protein CusA/SilA